MIYCLKHRRLDIIVVPYNEYPTSLLYFTGSAHFNRSMRLLAKQNGMSLSEHALKKNVFRKGSEKINEGETIITNSEESIFKHLNLKYRRPEVIINSFEINCQLTNFVL
jgi:DNA polymerase lambda